MAERTLDLRKPKTRAARRRRSSAKGARKTGHMGSAARVIAGGLRPRLPRPPAPDGTGGRMAPVVGWAHLLIDGSDAEFRRVVRSLAAVIRRIDQIHDLAGRAVGLSGTRLEFLLTLAEHADAERDPLAAIDGGSAAGGIRQVDLANLLDISPYYASAMARELAAKGLIERRAARDHPGRRVLTPTEAGWRAVTRAAPLIAGAHNAAFAPLGADEFAALRRIAPKLDEASAAAVEILARRAGERPWRSLRELLRLSERMGVR